MKLIPTVTLPMVLILAGAITAAVGTFLLYARQNSDRLKAAEERARFETELRAKSDEIAALNQKIADSVTGGDSYCYFFVGRPGSKSQLADLLLMTHGAYPLYDVSVKIDDVQKLVDLVQAKSASGELPYDSMLLANQALGQASSVSSLGNIGPNQAAHFGALDLSGRTKASWNIYFTARNGAVTQFVRFLRVGATWKFAFRVARGDEVLKEHVDEGFEPEW